MKGPDEALPTAWAAVSVPWERKGSQESVSPVPFGPGAALYHASFLWLAGLARPSVVLRTFGPVRPPAPVKPVAVTVSAKSAPSTAIPVSVSTTSWAALSMMPLPFQSRSSIPVGRGSPVWSGAMSLSSLNLPLPFTPAL